MSLVQIKRSGSTLEDGKMDYKEFVWFILSEEDKANDISLEYWFRCIDLDDNGCLHKNEMLVRPSSPPPIPLGRLSFRLPVSPFLAEHSAAYSVALGKLHTYGFYPLT